MLRTHIQHFNKSKTCHGLIFIVNQLKGHQVSEVLNGMDKVWQSQWISEKYDFFKREEKENEFDLMLFLFVSQLLNELLKKV